MIDLGIVVEDAYDGKAIAAIIERLLEGDVRVRAIRARGRSEIARKAPSLIGLASRSTSCVLVVVDLDGDDPAGRPKLRDIAAACRDAPVRARMVGIAQELEAWLLADPAAVLARRLDPAQVERWNASFRSFARLVRGCPTAEATAA